MKEGVYRKKLYACHLADDMVFCCNTMRPTGESLQVGSSRAILLTNGGTKMGMAIYTNKLTVFHLSWIDFVLTLKTVKPCFFIMCQ